MRSHSLPPSCLRIWLRSSPRPDSSSGNCFGCCSSLPTEILPIPSKALGDEVDVDSEVYCTGVGVGFSGACGLPLVWRARKPLPRALRSSANHQNRTAEALRHGGTVLETGADLRFPRLSLPLDRSENAVNQIIKFKSISHT